MRTECRKAYPLALRQKDLLRIERENNCEGCRRDDNDNDDAVEAAGPGYIAETAYWLAFEVPQVSAIQGLSTTIVLHGTLEPGESLESISLVQSSHIGASHMRHVYEPQMSSI